MRAMQSLVLTVFGIVVLVAPPVVLADGCLTLAVRDSTYARIRRLANPDYNGRDVGRAAAARS